MPSLAEVTLCTKRLLLRPLQQTDADALLRIHADAAVMQFSNSAPWSSIDQANDLIEQAVRGIRAGRHLCLGIIPVDLGIVVGTSTLFDFIDTSRRAELGFLLGSGSWGKGYMSEALGALTRHAFLELNLNRLEADTDPRNKRSLATLERLGFVREGYLRERWIVGEEKSDTVLLGLLRSDWEQTLGPLATSGA
jgi:ribosomal-protein-alanine N-acetyltransferase